MKKFVSIMIIFLGLIVNFSKNAQAVMNPLEKGNNKLGIHILDPNELEYAAKIVNANNQWGYVIVPLRVDDRDLDKWFNFFVKSSELKVIPVIRLAMHAENSGWAIPTDDEILYAANFLNQMPWPVENRYVIVFNEPNHALEWGGVLDPASYAERLNFAIDVFKSMNKRFFMLPAAMDRASANIPNQTMKADTYLQGIFTSRPELVNKIDGWNSHAYPNPAFSGSPNDKGSMGIVSYRQELAFMKKLGRENLPLFISETNWSSERLSNEKISQYWQQAWKNSWTDENLVMVGAWLLHASDGPFEQFTLTDKSFNPSVIGKEIMDLPRDKGDPVLSPRMTILSASIQNTQIDLDKAPKEHDLGSWWGRLKAWIKLDNKEEDNKKVETWKMLIGSKKIAVEIADEAEEQTLGLGYRTSLPENNGMLFIYDQSAYYTFWMKETLIPLDIIWIDNGFVVDITSEIPVDSNPSNPQSRFSPGKIANWVLETNAGWAKKNGIAIGDKVSLDK